MSEVRPHELQFHPRVISFLPCPYDVLCMQTKRDRGQDPGDEAVAKKPRIDEPVQEQTAQHEAPQQAPAEEPQPQSTQLSTVQHVTPQVQVLQLLHTYDGDGPCHLGGLVRGSSSARLL